MPGKVYRKRLRGVRAHDGAIYSLEEAGFAKKVHVIPDFLLRMAVDVRLVREPIRLRLDGEKNTATQIKITLHLLRPKSELNGAMPLLVRVGRLLAGAGCDGVSEDDARLTVAGAILLSYDLDVLVFLDPLRGNFFAAGGAGGGREARTSKSMRNSFEAARIVSLSGTSMPCTS